MAMVAILLIRVFLALVLGALGLFAVLVGLYLTLNRGFVPFGGPGAVALVFVLIGCGLLYGSGRLFKRTLASRAAGTSG